MITTNTHRLKARDLARNVYQCTPLRTIFVFSSLCFMLVAVCAFRVASPPIVLTIADNGKTVTVPSGTQITIQLPENSGSTGYTWNYTTSKNQVLTLQNTTYLSPAGHTMIGASGIVAFTFLAAHDTGSVNMQFVLQRGWDTKTPPARRFTVTIQVQHDIDSSHHRY